MTDPRIEAVARAMCEAAGFGPDGVRRGYRSLWKAWIHEAIPHVAAYDALRKMEKENGDGRSF